MPKKSTVGAGLGPLIIMIFLFIAATFAMATGRSLFQLGTRILIVIAFVGFLYLVWQRLAKRNPLFKSEPGQSTIVLALVAVAFLFVADPLATSLQLSLMPSPMSIGSYNIGLGYVGIISLVIAAIVLAILAYTVLRRKKKHR